LNYIPSYDIYCSVHIGSTTHTSPNNPTSLQLLTLSTTVLAAGYKFINNVSSAPEDFKRLICETAYLSTVLSQLISHSLSEQSGPQIAYHTLIQQGVLQDCEKILRNIQLLICDCERRNITMNALL
jgi:hypothetical protein